jgi:hypothetical protein
MKPDFLGARVIGMRSHFLLVAALAALAAQPASAENTGAALTSPELQRLISGNELTAISIDKIEYRDSFRPDGTLYRSAQMVGSSPTSPQRLQYVTDGGTWSIEENKLCRQLSSWHGGRKSCAEVVRTERGYQVIYPAGRIYPRIVEDVTFKNLPTR